MPSTHTEPVSGRSSVPAGPYDADNFAFIDVKVDALEHFQCAKAFGYVSDSYHWHFIVVVCLQII